MKYSDWINEWFDNYVKPTTKNKTIACYKSVINKHIVPGLGDYEIGDITPILLQKFITDLLNKGNSRTGRGLSSNTVNLIITIIQVSLETASRLELTNHYVADKVKRPRSKEKKIECFSLAEQKKIEAAVLSHKKVKMFGILLCLYTGLRIGELMALKWSDIDFVKKELHVTKSCSDGFLVNGKYGRLVDTPKTDTSVRTIPIPKQLVPLLKDVKRRNESEYVVGDGDKEISIRSYQRSFELLLKRLNIEHKGFHALRHTFATRACEAGMDIKTLSEILGHKNPSVTLSRYAHSFWDHKKQMMNKVGAFL